jgi:hypothetical protein
VPRLEAGRPRRHSRVVEQPVNGLLFDVEHCDFWWHGWGRRPEVMASRLYVARRRSADVPRLTPLGGHLYVGEGDDSPVFSIVQADLYVPALTLPDLVTGGVRKPYRWRTTR